MTGGITLLAPSGTKLGADVSCHRPKITAIP